MVRGSKAKYTSNQKAPARKKSSKGVAHTTVARKKSAASRAADKTGVTAKKKSASKKTAAKTSSAKMSGTAAKKTAAQKTPTKNSGTAAKNSGAANRKAAIKMPDVEMVHSNLMQMPSYHAAKKKLAAQTMTSQRIQATTTRDEIRQETPRRIPSRQQPVSKQINSGKC